MFAFSNRSFCFSDSEESEEEFDLETSENPLMYKPGNVEGILFEVERENRLRVQVHTAFSICIHSYVNF